MESGQNNFHIIANVCIQRNTSASPPVALGKSTNFNPVSGSKAKHSVVRFFFSLSFHCVIENWFSVSFVALFNRILNGFSLPETSAKIIVCLCVKSHLENLLPLKVMYRLGATMWGQLLLFMHSHRKSETIDLVSIL